MSGRDVMERLMEAVPKRQRAGAALALCVQVLDSFAKHSMLPTQARMAKDMADIARAQIPADVAALMSGIRSGDPKCD